MGPRGGAEAAENRRGGVAAGAVDAILAIAEWQYVTDLRGWCEVKYKFVLCRLPRAECFFIL